MQKFNKMTLKPFIFTLVILPLPVILLLDIYLNTANKDRLCLAAYVRATQQKISRSMDTTLSR
jgi:hypothetical protein